MRKSNPKITETFADLKRDLAETMTAEDWEVNSSLGDRACSLLHLFQSCLLMMITS